MLIKTDSNRNPILARDLVEKTRDFDDAAARDNAKREADTMTPDKAGMDITDAEQRVGRSMSAWTFQQKLQKIREFLVFERSNADPSITGVYIQSNVYDPNLYKGRLVFICGMGSGVMPEFSIIETEEYEVPTANGPVIERRMKCEVRGWRSVLAALLKARILSAYDIEKNFHVSLGKDSQRWQQVCEGRIEIVSMEAENVGQDQGTPDTERRGSDPRDDGQPRQLSGSDADRSPDDRNHQGITEAGRRDGGGEGRSGAQAPDQHEADDRVGEDRVGEHTPESGTLLS